MLGHPVMMKAVSAFKRRLWLSPDTSGLHRWTVVSSSLKDDHDIVFEFSFQISMLNRLGERFRTGLMEIRVIVDEDGVFKTVLGSFKGGSNYKSLKKSRISEETLKIREYWPDVVEAARTQRKKLVAKLERQIKKDLKKELKEQSRSQKKMFREREKSLEMQKSPKYLEKLRKDLAMAEKKAMQLTFSEDRNRQHRQRLKEIQEKMSDAEWERQHSHVKVLKERLEKEKVRMLESILPRRFALADDGIEVQVAGVKVILNDKGGED